MPVKTPFFVSTEYDSFEQYIKKLSRDSRRNALQQLEKYSNVEYMEISRNEGLKLKPIMEKIWRKQIIRGKSAAGMGDIPIKNNTRFFACKLNKEFVMLHCVEQYKNYIYCHMPMHDKLLYPSLSKYSWFNLIKYIIENIKDCCGIDMGGECGKDYPHNCTLPYKSCNPHFKYLIENRKKLSKYKYKYIYLTKGEKDINNAKKLIIFNNKVVELK